MKYVCMKFDTYSNCNNVIILLPRIHKILLGLTQTLTDIRNSCYCFETQI